MIEQSGKKWEPRLLLAILGGGGGGGGQRGGRGGSEGLGRRADEARQGFSERCGEIRVRLVVGPDR